MSNDSTEPLPRVEEIRSREYRLQTIAGVLLLVGGMLGMMMLTVFEPGDPMSRIATVAALIMPLTFGVACYYSSKPNASRRWAVWAGVGFTNALIVYYAASL
jgi:hypothetical protein